MAIVKYRPTDLRGDPQFSPDTETDLNRRGRRSARRYADTFLRLWYLALIPMLVLPAAGFGVAYMMKGSATVVANIWVSQDSTKHLPYTDPLANPAANVASALQQLLQTQSFDLRVARESPLYWATMVDNKNRDIAIVSDISKKVLPIAPGPDLVSLTYTNKNGAAGVQLLQNILTEAPAEIGKLNAKQSATTVAYYEHQRSAAQHALDRATRALGHYASKHHISPAQMADRALFDPTFASLYQAVQSAQVAVHGADQQLSQAVGPNGLGSSIQVIDPPSAEPSQTSKKQLLLDVGIGLIAGLVLAGAFVVWMTAIDRSLRYPEEVAQLLGIRVLASTPNVPALARNGSKKRRSGQ
jgi:uncharacterized protein involved in exopolysaccharide biosynthesis